MNRLIETIRNIFKIEELRKRILFTVLIILVYRFGAFVVIPGIDPNQLSALRNSSSQGFLNQYKNDAYRGFFDLPEYKKLMPNKKEWEMQGSYLVSDLIDPTRKFGSTSLSKVSNGSRRTRVADRSNLKKGEHKS